MAKKLAAKLAEPVTYYRVERVADARYGVSLVFHAIKIDETRGVVTRRSRIVSPKLCTLGAIATASEHLNEITRAPRTRRRLP